MVGLFFGYLLTSLLQRRKAGGKNAAQLRKEMEGYRAEVNDHFTRTAELFKESTEKYRDLYEHLAGGAQKLADDLPDRAQLEFQPGKLLANSDDTVAVADFDEEALVDPKVTVKTV